MLTLQTYTVHTCTQNNHQIPVWKQWLHYQYIYLHTFITTHAYWQPFSRCWLANSKGIHWNLWKLLDWSSVFYGPVAPQVTNQLTA